VTIRETSDASVNRSIFHGQPDWRKGIPMLERYFKSTRARLKLRVGPLGPHLDGFAQHLHDQGYAHYSTRDTVRHAAHWSRYAHWLGKREASEMTPALATQFLNEHLPTCSCEQLNSGKFKQAGAALALVTAYLRRTGCLPPEPEPPTPPPDGIAAFLQRYDTYLQQIHGLADTTRATHRYRAAQFLLWWREHSQSLDLSMLTAPALLAYQHDNREKNLSVDWQKTVAGCLRMLLRFLRWERILTVDLTPAVYCVIQWQQATLPRFISFEDVRRLLAMPDTESATGKRDLAMLTLFCLLGLRAGEVVRLNLGDIDWAQGQLHIVDNKARRERIVPLIPEVGRVLADYVQHGRPHHPSGRLFLRLIAPIKPFASGGSLWGTVNKYLVQAGITAKRRGPHLLRHSLATQLINQGVTIKEIADLLGHASVETTAIYAKVQISRLQGVGLPFPGRGTGGVA
jgi:site-specific recombinase XerD